MTRRLLFLLVAAWLFPSGGATQGTTSRVAGTVTDTEGGRLPGITVTLRNDETGVTFTRVTNESGNYAFESVQVGRYTVTCELQGFKRFVSAGNQVRIGEPATINAALELGAIEQTIEVRATGSTFDQRTIESLPILGGRGRNPLDLVLTQPGVVSGGGQRRTNGGLQHDDQHGGPGDVRPTSRPLTIARHFRRTSTSCSAASAASARASSRKGAPTHPVALRFRVHLS